MSAVLHLIKEFPSFFAFHMKAQPEAYRFSQLENGLPKGAVVEVSGSSGRRQDRSRAALSGGEPRGARGVGRGRAHHLSLRFSAKPGGA